MMERRKQLGGSIPRRVVRAKQLTLPGDGMYAELKQGSGKHSIATTMALVRLLKDWMKDPEIGQRIVPIAPDEYRTFGMDSMFPSAKVYNPGGMQYESVDRKLLLSYKESVQGQMLHEGISEAGAMASATAAGSAYSTHGEHMIPFYIFYSMFGFQRTGDAIWAMADQLARGFLIGATAGRTTLTGEGLQHADGHSPLLAVTNPAVVHYDPAFAYEISHIMRSGLERMYGETEDHPHGEDVIFYITVYNEPVVQPAEPDDVDVEGILRGLHRVETAEAPQVQLLASGVGFPWIREAARLLAEEWGVQAEQWSVTSWNELARDGVAAEEWNLLHPDEEARTAYVSDKLAGFDGPTVAVSDYMRAVPLQIARWVPGDYRVLGADGFGFADTRPAARRFFHIDAESVVVQALQALADAGKVDRGLVKKAMDKYRIDDPTAVADRAQEGGDAYGDPAAPAGLDAGLEAGLRVQGRHQVLHPAAERPDADAELPGDDLVLGAGDQQGQDVAVPGRELLRRRSLVQRYRSVPVGLEEDDHRVQQRGAVDHRRLRQRTVQGQRQQGGVSVDDHELDRKAGQHPRLLARRDQLLDVGEGVGTLQGLRRVDGPPPHAAGEHRVLLRIVRRGGVRRPVEEQQLLAARGLQLGEPARRGLLTGEDLDERTRVVPSTRVVLRDQLRRRGADVEQLLLATLDQRLHGDVGIGRRET